MAIINEDYWTEQAILDLPDGEDDNFERKGGLHFADEVRLRETLGKAVSAFANCGGGHVLLGVDDHGRVDGVPRNRAKKSGAPGHSSREWLEHLLPTLVDYPLQTFNVQEVTPTISPVVADHVILVINVRESPLAPHQCKADRIYYWRQSGHSVPAPHVFVDLLRHRPRAATLVASLDRVDLGPVPVIKGDHPNMIFVQLECHFNVENTSASVSAESWDVALQGFASMTATREGDYFPTIINRPNRTADRDHGSVFLPGTSILATKQISLRIQPASTDWEHVEREMQALLNPALTLKYKAVSDTWAGAVSAGSIQLAPLPEKSQIIARAWRQLTE